MSCGLTCLVVGLASATRSCAASTTVNVECARPPRGGLYAQCFPYSFVVGCMHRVSLWTVYAQQSHAQFHDDSSLPKTTGISIHSSLMPNMLSLRRPAHPWAVASLSLRKRQADMATLIYSSTTGALLCTVGSASGKFLLARIEKECVPFTTGALLRGCGVPPGLSASLFVAITACSPAQEAGSNNQNLLSLEAGDVVMPLEGRDGWIRGRVLVDRCVAQKGTGYRFSCVLSAVSVFSCIHLVHPLVHKQGLQLT